MTGGDRARRSTFAVGGGADVTLTTQAAEKIYRALTGRARIAVRALAARRRARLEWLPQETILFTARGCAAASTLDSHASARC